MKYDQLNLKFNFLGKKILGAELSVLKPPYTNTPRSTHGLKYPHPEKGMDK